MRYPHLLSWICLASVLLAACRSAPPPVTPELVARTNHGVGLMGQYDFDGAVRAFEALLADRPGWPEGQLNLAIALMNRQGDGDPARADALLAGLQDDAAVARRAGYTRGILLLHEGREDEALPLLRQAAEATPPDGYAAYFVGQIRVGENPAEALEWYGRAAAHEPMLRSAYYGAFLALRRLGRDDEASAMLARFQALDGHPQAVTAEFKYTRMGPLSEAVTVDIPGPPAEAPPAGPRFLPPVPLVTDAGMPWQRDDERPRSITVADIDGDGALDLFVTGAFADTPSNAVLLARNGAYRLDRAHPLASVPGVHAALWGDLDDDGRVDVVLCRPAGGTQIWRQSADGAWADTTRASGVGLGRADMVEGAVFDADHDGDLDIWLVNAAGPNELLNNDGGWRFRAIGAAAGIAGDGRPSRAIAVTDLDGDRDADVIVLKASPPHDVFLNGRVWQYQRNAEAAALARAPISALVPADLDADGRPELYALGDSGLERWRRGDGGVWQREAVAANVEAPPGSRLAVADTSGTGAMEVLVPQAGGWMAYAGTGSATPLEAAAGAVRAWTVAHLDASAGPSLVGIDTAGVPQIWRPGPGRHRYLGLRFSGRDPQSDQRRSNVSGIGARVALRAGSRWTAFDTTRLDSGPGQSLQPTAVGLGGAPRADFVAVTWSDGVYQTELALDAGRLHDIHETQRQLSSCPVLFAWDGSRFRFLTDVLGVGGIGFFERPGVYSAPYPRENLLLPEGVLAPRDGAYELKIAEPMEEVTYLDQAALVAYDLPPGWQMVLDERKAITGPQPTGTPMFYREERLPTGAVTGSGEDVTARLAHADLAAAGPARVNPRFIGLADPFSVTMTFDRALERGPGRPVLVIDGWVEYPYAQTVFAAWQAGAIYQAPTLEALGGDGRWRVVAAEFGYPAGMPRRMAFPLPPLPAGTTALRLTTSQEIYWDRVAVVYAEPAPEVRRATLPLRDARLEADGFARRTTGPQRTPHYDDDARAPLADTRHPRGWYTTFGSVAPLVSDEDSAVAIFGPGEAVTVRFDVPASRVPEGWTRRLVLELRGWCKDMDLYTLDGDTIDPLPGEPTAARARLHPQFNTRYAGGR